MMPSMRGSGVSLTFCFAPFGGWGLVEELGDWADEVTEAEGVAAAVGLYLHQSRHRFPCLYLHQTAWVVFHLLRSEGICC